MRSFVVLVGVTCLFTFPIKIMAQSPAPCLKIKQFWTSYDALRQNGNMDVKLVWKTHGCLIPTKVNGTPELTSITVAIQDVSGLEVHMGGIGFTGGLNDGQNNGSRELEVELHLTASRDVPVGSRMFLARIDYDVLNRKGIFQRERLYAPIPIRVVAENAQITQRYEHDHWSPWQLLLLPVSILEYLGEALTGQIC